MTRQKFLEMELRSEIGAAVAFYLLYLCVCVCFCCFLFFSIRQLHDPELQQRADSSWSVSGLLLFLAVDSEGAQLLSSFP